MKENKGIEFGFFILSLGILFLLVNIGIINWSIMNALFDLWPVIFIVIGVNIIFKNNSIVRIITWLLFLAALVSYGYYFDTRWEEPGKGWTNNVSVEKYAETQKGELKLELGGTRISLDSTDANLVEAYISNPDVRNNVSYKNGKSTAVVKFERDRLVNIIPDGGRDESRFKVNDGMIWDIDIDAGAVNGTLDMSKLQVEKMDIDMGAGNLDLMFGDKHKYTNVDLDAGASSFEVVIPSTVGVKINMDGALNNTNLKDLNWNRRGNNYVSPNYDSAESRIDMDVDMGVGKFTVIIQ